MKFFYFIGFLLLVILNSCREDHSHTLDTFEGIENENDKMIERIYSEKETIETYSIFQKENSRVTRGVLRANQILYCSVKAYSDLSVIMRETIDGFEWKYRGDSTLYPDWTFSDVLDREMEENPLNENTSPEIRNKIISTFYEFSNMVVHYMDKLWYENKKINWSISNEMINQGLKAKEISDILYDSEADYDKSFMKGLLTSFTLKDYLKSESDHVCIYSFLEQMNLIRNKILLLTYFCLNEISNELSESPFLFNKIEPIVFKSFQEGDSTNIFIALYAYDTTAIPEIRYQINGTEHKAKGFHITIPSSINQLEGTISVKEGGELKWKPWRYVKQ
ncbi:MAG: hypothetical protein ACOZCO_08685 [Bacteroidota bacterium]